MWGGASSKAAERRTRGRAGGERSAAGGGGCATALPGPARPGPARGASGIDAAAGGGGGGGGGGRRHAGPRPRALVGAGGAPPRPVPVPARRAHLGGAADRPQGRGMIAPPSPGRSGRPAAWLPRGAVCACTARRPGARACRPAEGAEDGRICGAAIDESSASRLPRGLVRGGKFQPKDAPESMRRAAARAGLKRKANGGL